MSRNDNYAIIFHIIQIIINSWALICQGKKCKYSATNNFIGKLDKDDGATMFFITENQQKNYSKLPLDSFIVTE